MKLDHGNITDSLVVWMNRYIDNARVNGCCTGTTELYSRILNNFIDYANQYSEYTMNDINRLFINSYLLEIQGKLSKSTVSVHLTIIKSFFSFISNNNSDEYDYASIFKKIKIKVPKREMPYLNESEIARLLNTIEKEKSRRTYIPFRNALMIKLMLYGGARVSEAAHTKYGDIVTADIDQSFYKILIIGKGDKQAPIYIKKDIVEEELQYLNAARHYKDDDYLFAANSGNLPDRTNVYLMIKRLFKLSGIKKTGVHILRHTLAMRLAARNVDILHIQKIMRHANIQTTMIYAHSTETDSVRALGKIKEDF